MRSIAADPQNKREEGGKREYIEKIEKRKRKERRERTERHRERAKENNQREQCAHTTPRENSYTGTHADKEPKKPKNNAPGKVIP